MTNLVRLLKAKVRGRSGSRGRPSDTGNNAPKEPENLGLHLLHPNLPTENEASTETYEVDIIAIHGLNGKAYGTWTHEDTSTLWLKDFLPHDIPGARIYTYSYSSHVFLSKSKATIQDFAQKLLYSAKSIRGKGEERRHIIFIAHSLGGIICKQALIMAKENPDFNVILDHTIGVFFFGTPHRGARDLPQLGILLGNILDTLSWGAMARPFAGTSRLDLLEDLKASSSELCRITESFSYVYSTIQIVTIYETEEQAPLGKLVVDKDSAMMGIDVEKRIPRDFSHTDICRFASRSDPDYPIILKEIRDLCQKAHYVPSLRESEKACVRLFNEFDLNEYKSSLPQRVDGTCKWVLESPQYEHWVQEPHASLLWITGHPGSGKTILSKYITEQLERGVASNREDPIVCCFFCNEGIEKQNDARAILRSFIFQILIERQDLVKHVKPALDYDKDGIHLLKSYDRLWSIFVAIIGDVQLSPVSIVIDALDECEKTSRKRLMESIATLIGRFRSISSHCIRFLITSRPYLTINGCFTDYEPQRLPLEEKRNEIDGDLRLVIGKRVEKIARQNDTKQDDIASLERSLNENADRTFLWAILQLDILDEELLTSPGDSDRILRELPRDLEATYERFLHKIHPSKERFAIKLLRLIIGSFRPLSLDEVNIAVSMQEATKSDCHDLAGLSRRHLHTNMRADIRKVLGPLIRISDSKVYLVHLSLKEFLCTKIQDMPDRQLSERYHMDLRNAGLLLASACIAYLSLDDFSGDLYSKAKLDGSSGSPVSLVSLQNNLQGELPEPETYQQWEGNMDMFGNILQEPQEIDADTCASLAQRYIFFEYSAIYWARHFAQSQEVAGEQLLDQALCLSDKNTGHQFSNWFHFFWAKRESGLTYPLDFDQFVIAGFFDHITSLEGLLGRAASDCQDSLALALYWASRNGLKRSVMRLLLTDLDPDSKPVGSQSPLGIAAELGHLEVARALATDARVNINFEDMDKETPLSKAVSSGNAEIVKLLLDDDRININSKNRWGRTPLFWATNGNHPTVTKMLVEDSKVDVNCTDKNNRTAFSWAAEGGDEGVLALLLEVPSIVVHLRSDNGWTPLAFAAFNGRSTVIRQLQRKGLLKREDSQRDKIGRNVFALAAWGGHDDFIRLLVEYEVFGIDEEDKSKWTPLFWALESPRSSTIETLIKTGSVAVNHRDHSGRTALSWTVSYGNEAILHLLLAAPGIDLLMTDDCGMTPLDWARKLENRSHIANMLEGASR